MWTTDDMNVQFLRRKRPRCRSFLSKASLLHYVAILLVCFTSIPSGRSFLGTVSIPTLNGRRELRHSSTLPWSLHSPLSSLSSGDAGRSDQTSYEDTLYSIEECKKGMNLRLRQRNYKAAFQVLSNLFASLDVRINAVDDKEKRVHLAERVDDVVQTFTSRAFVQGSRSTSSRAQTMIMLGTEAIQLQLSSSLPFPYNLVPKRTLLNALKSLTALNEVQRNNDSPSFSSTDIAFRILQRLITGVGVRTRGKAYIAEQDFNMVLNAYSNAGRMDMAHRTIALQERTKHAPPLSPVTYSCLFKGYGRLGDIQHVEVVLDHAEKNGIEPDTVMANSLIDAYVNCNAFDKAQAVFSLMERPTANSTNNDGIFMDGCPRPNARTYNTILKGLAKSGAVDEAMSLAREMDAYNLSDHITTNTLVHAAVDVGDFALAESVLANRTAESSKSRRKHPNVEAYTKLLDGYSKDGQLEKALSVLRLMRQRGVEPNEITYTCLIAGFGRGRKTDQARKTIDFMLSVGIRPSCITYNALISAIVESSDKEGSYGMEDLDPYVDEALRVLRDMMQSGVRPNAVTVSTLVSALGHCSTPRVEEAKVLVEKLEREKVIPSGNKKVVTALVQTCGLGGDIKGAIETFRSLQVPDLVAVNAFLDACCRCGRDRLAFETFNYYFRKMKSKSGLQPDVISYSVLISSCLKKRTSDSIRQANALYVEMKNHRGIVPDTTLVDIILKEMVRIGRVKRLTKIQFQFATSVLRDAEKLTWDEGQLERRKRAVHSIEVEDAWKKDEGLYGLLTPEQDDDLFKRKGWNKIDSGFHLWGSPSEPSNPKTKPAKAVDQFLESKGWNDVDSGFRII